MSEHIHKNKGETVGERRKTKTKDCRARAKKSKDNQIMGRLDGEGFANQWQSGCCILMNDLPRSSEAGSVLSFHANKSLL